MAKVTVVGAGNVGAACAHAILRQKFADVALIDIDEGLAKGKALDLSQAGTIERFENKIVGSADYRESSDSDVVVVTAGLPRRPGMIREELLDKNAKIIGDVVERALDASPDARIIIVTNPLDLMVHLAHKTSGVDHRRVLGMGGILDTARFKHFIAASVGTTPNEVDAIVIGSHSDSMVPLVTHATVGGKPLTGLLSEETIADIVEKTRKGGAEIVSYLKNGSAFYAPGAAAADMAGAILRNERRVVPACVLSSGAYGVEDLYIGVPVTLGAAGAGEIIELALSENEREAFSLSAAEILAGVASLERRLA